MSREVRSFVIPDGDPEPARAEFAGFLRSVLVDRIDSAYADGAWHLLVLYQDARRKEESKQIESAIRAALSLWRDRQATGSGKPRDAILPESALTEIAHYAPTTERELMAIASAEHFDVGSFGTAIVQQVKKTLDDLNE